MDERFTRKERICIVGAGLVGSLLSIILGQRGYQVDLIEKRCDMRKEDIPGGRTIAMSLSHRGFEALSLVGLKDYIKQHTVAKSSRMVHLKDGTVHVQEYGRDGQAIHTINRKFINSALLDKAEATGNVNTYFESHCVNLNLDKLELELVNKQTGKCDFRQYDRIIGADGVFSKVANEIAKQEQANFERFSPEYGYKELVIPTDSENNWKLNNKVVHVWPQGHFNLVALPNTNKTFTCTLFLKLNGEISLNTLNDHKLIANFFNKHFPDVSRLIPNYCEQFMENPVSKIYSLKCAPWQYRNKVLLIGDACHAIAPFFAMGMNVGFEDCTVFESLITKLDGDLDKVFDEFSRVRKVDTDAIADLSLQNFTSLGTSDKSNYHLKWQINRLLWNKLNNDWMPLYPMIAFSSIPLAEVRRRSTLQAYLIDKIINEENPSEVTDQWIDYIHTKYIKDELEKKNAYTNGVLEA